MLDVAFLFLAVAIGFLIGSLFAYMLGINSRKVLIVLTLSISLCIGLTAFSRFNYVREKIYLRAVVLAFVLFGLSWFLVTYYSGGSLHESFFSRWLMILTSALTFPIVVGAKFVTSISK